MTLNEYINKLGKDIIIFNSNNDFLRADIVECIAEDLKALDKGHEEKYTKLLLVEDGSIDLEKEQESLEALGYKVLVYRQNSNKPEVINI